MPTIEPSVEPSIDRSIEHSIEHSIGAGSLLTEGGLLGAVRLGLRHHLCQVALSGQMALSGQVAGDDCWAVQAPFALQGLVHSSSAGWTGGTDLTGGTD